MAKECTDCGGEMSRGRPTRTGTGLPIRFSALDEGGAELLGGESVDVVGWTCEDCGRVRFEVEPPERRPADTSAASGECPLCSGPTVAGRPGGAGFDLRLVDAGSDLPGTDRYPLFGHACVDCGAVGLYADGVNEGSGSDTTCPACEGNMRRTSVSTGTGSLRLVGDKQGGGALAQRQRVDPMAWACEDCGLALLYDERGGA